MGTKIWLRRGTAAEAAAMVPEDGEPLWLSDTKQLAVGDATTSGGITIGGIGEGVTSLNSLYDAITIAGAGEIVVTEVGQTITISGGADVDSLNSLTGDVTISGAGISVVTEDGQSIIITSTETTDVDSVNSLTDSVTIAGAGNITVSEAGQIITVSGTIDDTPQDGVTNAGVSSNWAYDHENDTSTHGVSGSILGTEDVDDAPVSGATTAPVSSNWAWLHDKYEDFGSDTITSGNSSVAVSHDIGFTPTTVICTGKTSETSSLWVTSIGASTFTANVAAAVTDDRDFYWFAKKE